MYFAKRLVGFGRWVLPAMGTLAQRTGDRRVLVVYDFGSQSLSIGDVLCFNEAALVLSEQHGVERVDFAAVFDRESPLGPQNPIHKTLPPEEFAYQVSPLLPLLQFSPKIGSTFIFDNRQDLERFVTDNHDRYTVWPSARVYAGREYYLYGLFNDLLHGHYSRSRELPVLSARAHLVEWARAFCSTVAPGLVPVTVHLRQNPRFGTDRNSHIPSWVEFFNHCDGRYPVKFIVIGALAEIDATVRKCPNVVIAKDHLTSIEQDLTLVQASAIHMGADSGPVVMAVFGRKPYLCANSTALWHLHRDVIEEGDFRRFYFATPYQRYSVGQETARLLISEFDRMLSQVDLSVWQSMDVSGHRDLTSWLR